MDSPSNFINWSDYLGVNQEQADAQAKKLLGGVDVQSGQLADFRNAAVNHATQAGLEGEANPYQGREGDYSNAQMNYGDALERLRDPATRQAIMQKQFGSGTALDAAMVGSSAGFSEGIDSRKAAEVRNKDTSQSMIAQRFGDAQKGRVEGIARDAADKANRQGAYDRLMAARAATAKSDRERRALAYANYGGRDFLNPKQNTLHDKPTATSNAMFGGMFGGDTRSTSQIDEDSLRNYEAGIAATEKAKGKKFGVGANGEGYWG